MSTHKEMDKKQKQYLRAKICQLMDEGKAGEAKKWMDLLLVDEQKRGRKPNSQFTQVRVTRPDGEEQIFKSIAETARTYHVTPQAIRQVIYRGIPTRGVLKGFLIEYTGVKKDVRSKPILATLPDGTRKQYESIRHFRRETGIADSYVYRSLSSGNPIASGRYAGWQFERVEEQ
ncbi:hypothetical protein [Enterococcus asini]|uniref:hypothetical protein n=1 Tax=Enterococcus asini TaxID=57732 RepID=UPI001E63B872|nr:hypothetical protein [Enterococcus asini]MCD5028701.1 hypothetical protein [Enterococcus asini]